MSQNVNVPASRQAVLVDAISPQSLAPGSANTGWIAAKDAHLYLCGIGTGTLGASATVDAKLQQATDGSGTGAKDIAGKAITQIVKATGDDKSADLNLRKEELDINNGFTHFQLQITVGTAASEIGGQVRALHARYAPQTANARLVEEVL